MARAEDHLNFANMERSDKRNNLKMLQPDTFIAIANLQENYKTK